MTSRARLVSVVGMIVIVAAAAVTVYVATLHAQDRPETRPVLPATIQHGHLVDIPEWRSTQGDVYRASEYAFLAIRLSYVAPESEQITYLQWVDYLNDGRYYLPFGATKGEAIWTSQATPDGWLILPLAKPCGPHERETDVGLVIVCPPNTEHRCVLPFSGIVPLFEGTPEEKVTCTNRRRSARSSN